jgi:hypothetical protein
MRVLLTAALVSAGALSLSAQGVKDQLPPEIFTRHLAGDSVQPAFEGWQPFPDGHIALWFGYLNRNTQEHVNVPIGPNNNFAPGPDQGQPTYFYPRRQKFVFKIDLPKDWPRDKKMTWTVTANGETCTAIGWLQPEWELDDGVIQMNRGAGLAPPVDPPNKAPVITGGSRDQTIRFGQPATLTASATDDGIPKSRGPRGGLVIKWILYRGPGEVRFEPETSAPVSGKPAEGTTQASFSAPGTYWIRAIASDGLLEANHDVKVTVADAPAPR